MGSETQRLKDSRTQGPWDLETAVSGPPFQLSAFYFLLLKRSVVAVRRGAESWSVDSIYNLASSSYHLLLFSDVQPRAELGYEASVGVVEAVETFHFGAGETALLRKALRD